MSACARFALRQAARLCTRRVRPDWWAKNRVSAKWQREIETTSQRKRSCRSRCARGGCARFRRVARRRLEQRLTAKAKSTSARRLTYARPLLAARATMRRCRQRSALPQTTASGCAAITARQSTHRFGIHRRAAARVEEASGKRVDEWSDGFEQRFGLYRVDFDTKRRTPKLSASFYRETIARNAVA